MDDKKPIPTSDEEKEKRLEDAKNMTNDGAADEVSAKKADGEPVQGAETEMEKDSENRVAPKKGEKEEGKENEGEKEKGEKEEEKENEGEKEKEKEKEGEKEEGMEKNEKKEEQQQTEVEKETEVDKVKETRSEKEEEKETVDENVKEQHVEQEEEEAEKDSEMEIAKETELEEKEKIQKEKEIDTAEEILRCDENREDFDLKMEESTTSNPEVSTNPGGTAVNRSGTITPPADQGDVDVVSVEANDSQSADKVGSKRKHSEGEGGEGKEGGRESRAAKTRAVEEIAGTFDARKKPPPPPVVDEEKKKKKEKKQQQQKDKAKKRKSGAKAGGVDLYCVCRQPYDDSKFMLACDFCNEWYHGSCVGLTETAASRIDKYKCPACRGVFPKQAKKKEGSENKTGSRPTSTTPLDDDVLMTASSGDLVVAGGVMGGLAYPPGTGGSVGMGPGLGQPGQPIAGGTLPGGGAYASGNHPSSKMKCYLCNKVIKGITNLHRHLAWHERGDHGQAPQACPSCGDEKSSKAEVDHHLLYECDQASIFPCPGCTYQFPTKRDLRRHIAALHPSIQTFRCPICKLACFDKRALVRHWDLSHRGLKGRTILCSEPGCNRTFSTSEHLTLHQAAVHRRAAAKFWCPCGLGFFFESQLKAHALRDHTSNRTNSQARLCEICNDLFGCLDCQLCFCCGCNCDEDDGNVQLLAAETSYCSDGYSPQDRPLHGNDKSFEIVLLPPPKKKVKQYKHMLLEEKEFISKGPKWHFVHWGVEQSPTKRSEFPMFLRMTPMNPAPQTQQNQVESSDPTDPVGAPAPALVHQHPESTTPADTTTAPAASGQDVGGAIQPAESGDNTLEKATADEDATASNERATEVDGNASGGPEVKSEPAEEQVGGASASGEVSSKDPAAEDGDVAMGDRDEAKENVGEDDGCENGAPSTTFGAADATTAGTKTEPIADSTMEDPTAPAASEQDVGGAIQPAESGDNTLEKAMADEDATTSNERATEVDGNASGGPEVKSEPAEEQVGGASASGEVSSKDPAAEDGDVAMGDRDEAKENVGEDDGCENGAPSTTFGAANVPGEERGTEVPTSVAGESSQDPANDTAIAHTKTEPQATASRDTLAQVLLMRVQMAEERDKRLHRQTDEMMKDNAQVAEVVRKVWEQGGIVSEIVAGDTVCWTNVSNATQTVTQKQSNETSDTQLFNGWMDPFADFQFTFKLPGVYEYGSETSKLIGVVVVTSR